ncbi:MAG: hypothetical protein AAFS07_18885 [Pseudomonadota bacterium]
MLETALAQMPVARYTIRARADTERDLARVRREVDAYESGEKRRDYLRAAQPYLQLYQSLSRVGGDPGATSDEVHRSLARLAEQHLSVPMRRRSDLERTVRVATQRDEARVSAHSLVDEFMSAQHGAAPPVHLNHADLCADCHTALVRVQDSTLMCPHCGITVHTQEATTQSVAFNDERTYSKFQYKQDQHFRDHLRRVSQARDVDTTEICDLVMQDLHRQGVRPESLKFGQVRALVDKHDKKRWAPHAVRIWCDLTGQPVPQVTPDERERLCARFTLMAPVLIDLAPNRTNMASYPYLIRKFCVLEGFFHLVPFFPVPKGKANLQKLEVLFHRACDRLGWPFVAYEDEQRVPGLAPFV